MISIASDNRAKAPHIPASKKPQYHLVNKIGQYLHMSGRGVTDVQYHAWVGGKEQSLCIRRKNLLGGFTAVRSDIHKPKLGLWTW